MAANTASVPCPQRAEGCLPLVRNVLDQAAPYRRLTANGHVGAAGTHRLVMSRRGPTREQDLDVTCPILRWLMRQGLTRVALDALSSAKTSSLPDLRLSGAAAGFAATLRCTERTPFVLITTAPLDISSLQSYKAKKGCCRWVLVRRVQWLPQRHTMTVMTT
jgi:hypothetical protein